MLYCIDVNYIAFPCSKAALASCAFHFFTLVPFRMTNRYSAAVLLLLGTLAAHTAQAQEARRVQTKVVGDDNQPVLVQFNAEGKAAYRGVEASQVLRQELALTTNDQMRRARVEIDPLGFTVEIFFVL